ncbi:hypothetical protein HK102_011636 [Quaeritorhiza haematococci]|nr:hypothetical protein HK102_011636 [Quaeritorhiza haematococci]
MATTTPHPHLLQLPAETLWRIFLLTDSPSLVYKVIPSICSIFRDIVYSRSPVVEAHVELWTDEDDEGLASLLQPPKPPSLLSVFKRVRVSWGEDSDGRSDKMGRRKAEERGGNRSEREGSGGSGVGGSGRTGVWDSLPEFSTLHVGLEREVKVNIGAIPDHPEALVGYLTELLSKVSHRSTGSGISNSGGGGGGAGAGAGGAGAGAGTLATPTTATSLLPTPTTPSFLTPTSTTSSPNRLRPPPQRRFRVVFGTVEVKGRRNGHPTAPRAEVLGHFLSSLQPQNVSLWYWDSEVIRCIPGDRSPPTMRLPSMKVDGHITRSDLGLLSTFANLRRLELFRPMPREPWGVESNAFGLLALLPNLQDLVIRSGRLVGFGDVFVREIVQCKQLRRLELPWNLDGRLGLRLLQGLPVLKSLQYVTVSPDFWIGLPSYYRSVMDPLVVSGGLGLPAGVPPAVALTNGPGAGGGGGVAAAGPVGAGAVAAGAGAAGGPGPQPPAAALPPHPAPNPIQTAPTPTPISLLCQHGRALTSPQALTHLRQLGLQLIEPDMGDFTLLIESIIRTLPLLEDLSLRISRRNDSEYDFFSHLPRDFVERLLWRLNDRTRLKGFAMELGPRLWGSRKSYGDYLVVVFAGTRMKVRVCSPLARLG